MATNGLDASAQLGPRLRGDDIGGYGSAFATVRAWEGRHNLNQAARTTPAVSTIAPTPQLSSRAGGDPTLTAHLPLMGVSEVTKNCPRNALRILASPDLFLPLIPVPWGRDILPSLRPHRATRDERAGAQGRVVRGSPRTRRDRADRAGSFLGPGSGAGGHHDRCPSRSGWADRRPIPPERRRASTQGSHLSPLTVRAPGSQRRGDEPQCLRTTRVEASPRRCSSLPERARASPSSDRSSPVRGFRSPAKPGAIAVA